MKKDFKNGVLSTLSRKHNILEKQSGKLFVFFKVELGFVSIKY